MWIENPGVILPFALLVLIAIEGTAQVLVARCRRKEKQCQKKEKCPMAQQELVPTLIGNLRQARKAIDDYGTYQGDATLVRTPLPASLQHARNLLSQLIDGDGINEISFLREQIGKWNRELPAGIIPVLEETTASNAMRFSDRFASLLRSYADQVKWLQEAKETIQQKDAMLATLQREGASLMEKMEALASDNGQLRKDLRDLAGARSEYNRVREEIPVLLQYDGTRSGDQIGNDWNNLRKSVQNLINSHRTLGERVDELEKEKRGLDQMITDTEELSNKRANDLLGVVKQLEVANTKVGSLEAALDTARNELVAKDPATQWLSGLNVIYNAFPEEMREPAENGITPGLKIWGGICGSAHKLIKFYKDHKDAPKPLDWKDAFNIMLRGIPQPIMNKLSVTHLENEPDVMYRWRELCAAILELQNYYKANANIQVEPRSTATASFKSDPLDVAEKQCKEIFESRFGQHTGNDKTLSCAVQNVIAYLRELQTHECVPGQLYTGVFGFEKKWETSDGQHYTFGFTTMQQLNSFMAAIRFVNPPTLKLSAATEDENGRMFHVDVIDTTRRR